VEADSYLVEMLREEIGESDADIVWFPHIPRMLYHPEHPNPQHRKLGCWGVTRTFNEMFGMDAGVGLVMHCTRIPSIIMLLDGNHGNPTEPGRWIIDAINESDECRHGRRYRQQQTDDLRVHREKNKQKTRKAVVDVMKYDEKLRKGFAAQAERLGVSASDEEVLSMERAAAKVAQANADKDARELKQVRMYG
jgi:hypothetical protein